MAKNTTPKLVRGKPVEARVLVKQGYMTMDTTFYLNPMAYKAVDELEKALKEGKVRIWESADVWTEILRKKEEERTREMASNGEKLFRRLYEADLLKVFSETPDAKRPCEHDGRPVFADDVLAARVRLFGQHVPMVVVAGDKNLARTLLVRTDYDCARSSNISVFTLDEEGRFCPWTIAEEEKKEEEGIKPLSLLAARTTLEDACIPRSRLKRTVLGSDSSAKHVLIKRLAFTHNGTIHTIRDDEQHVVRLYDQPTIYTEAKARLLIKQKLNIKGAVLPIETVVNPMDGNFIGCILPKLEGVAMSGLLNVNGREKHCPGWTRVEFTRMALALVRRIGELAAKGILLGNMSPANIVVGRTEEGELDPDNILITGVEDAQFGNSDYGLFPAEGYDVKYAAPEYLREKGLSTGYVNRESVSYSAALLSLQLILGGAYPFDTDGTGESADAADRRFLFSAGDLHGMAEADEQANRVWSHNTRAFKNFMASILHQDGDKNKPEKRPTLQELENEIKRLCEWLMTKADDEDRSLTPLAHRAFMVECRICGKKFNANENSKESKRFSVCDECLAAPAGTCVCCDKPVDMTHGEMLRREIDKPPMTCKACGVPAAKKPAAKKIEPGMVFAYVKCPACGNARKQNEACMVCAAKEPAMKPAAEAAKKAPKKKATEIAAKEHEKAAEQEIAVTRLRAAAEAAVAAPQHEAPTAVQSQPAVEGAVVTRKYRRAAFRVS